MTKGESNFKSVRKKCKGDEPYENEFKKIGEGKVEKGDEEEGERGTSEWQGRKEEAEREEKERDAG